VNNFQLVYVSKKFPSSATQLKITEKWKMNDKYYLSGLSNFSFPHLHVEKEAISVLIIVQ
jgi:hypothetical protein